MPRITATLPEELLDVIEAAVALEQYESKSLFIRGALKSVFEDEYLRVTAANALYEADEVGAKEAFQLADVEEPELRMEFADVLGIEDAGDSGEEWIMDEIREGVVQDAPSDTNEN